ncbi:hypothetical protein HK102_002474, partial [Quaeritorhiza haematococci]
MKVGDTVLNNRYQLIKLIGEGSYGKVFRALDAVTQKYVAIKTSKTAKSQLGKEFKIYKKLENHSRPRWPKVWDFQRMGDGTEIMVMELLGKSLSSLKQPEEFIIKSVMRQCIMLLADLHRNGEVLHQDLKPDNVVFGRDDHSVVYLIDLGLSKPFSDYQEQCNLAGTIRYTSVNSHLGVHQSPRDDLISLGYVIIYILNGSLPWQVPKTLKAQTKHVRNEKIMLKKMSTPVEKLLEKIQVPSLHRALMEYMATVLSLMYHEVSSFFGTIVSPKERRTFAGRSLPGLKTVIVQRDLPELLDVSGSQCRCDQLVATQIEVNGGTISGVGSPMSNTDAANKAYVDSVAKGLKLKGSVRAASAPGQNVDLIQPVTTNGIYVITAAGFAIRAADLAAGTSAAGVFAFIESGAVHGDTGFVCVSDPPTDVVGLYALQFSQFNGNLISVGSGLAKDANNVISVRLDSIGSGLEFAGQSLRISPSLAGSGLAFGAGKLQVLPITQVATVSSGLWRASPIELAYGGTGNTSFVPGGIVFHHNGQLISDPGLLWDPVTKSLGINTTQPNNQLDGLCVRGQD